MYFYYQMGKKDKKGFLSLKDNVSREIVNISPLAKFTDPQQLQADIDNYFKLCEQDKLPVTMLGIANHLGVGKTTLHDYEHKKTGHSLSVDHLDAISNTIKRARDKCEQYAVSQLFRYSGNVAGVIFYLKNAFNYADKQEVQAHHSITIKIEDSTKQSKQIEHVELNNE